MTDERRGDPLDETVLRRALRLEPDERAPRFDPAALAAAARPRPAPAVLLGGALVLLGVALAATAIWTALVANAGSLAGSAAALLLGALAGAVALLYAVAEATADPAIPLSLIAGLGIAILHEMSARREHADVQAS